MRNQVSLSLFVFSVASAGMLIAIGGCNKNYDIVSRNEIVTEISDDQLLAIELARNSPQIMQYLRRFPQSRGDRSGAIWTVTPDWYFLGHCATRGECATYYRRSASCNYQYVVEVSTDAGIAKEAAEIRRLRQATRTAPSTTFGETAVLVDVRTGLHRHLTDDDLYVEQTSDVTSCLDGSSPKPFYP
jgi:hypothetical protein